MKAVRTFLPDIENESEKISPEILQRMVIKLQDFFDAMREIVPTAMREFYVESPKVWWREVGGLEDAKRTLEDNFITAIKEPAKFQKMGIKPPKGALLYGPSGCGKTLLARALATESGANMILVRGPEILSKWVGESEKAIREIFRKAKTSSPCIIIFDELDSLARSKSSEDGGVGERLLSQLLTEMEDGGASRVVVLGISNRPDLIDPSLIRPGRLDLVIFVPPPDEKGRFEIIRLLTKQMPLFGDINLKEIAVATKGYSGADLVAVCRDAAVNAMKSNSPKISSGDFATALKNVKPSITKVVEDWYSSVKDNISYTLPKPMDKAFYG